MEWREKEERLMVRRGKKIMIRTSTSATVVELRILAENKWKQYHPDLYEDNYKVYYSLLYENTNEIEDTLPGSNVNFTLDQYQKEIGKDFKRITFYLCKKDDLIIKNRVSEIYGDNNSSENEISDNDANHECKRLKLWDTENDLGHHFDEIIGDNIETNVQVTDEVVCNSITPTTTISESTQPMPQTKSNPGTILELVKELEQKVATEKQFFFVIRRNATISRVLTVWQRESKKQDLSNKLMVHFAGEDGIDDGALTRVFLTKAISGISKTMFPNGAPIDSMLHVQNGDYKACGQIVAYNITHGGPPPNFLHPNVVNLLINPDVDKENLNVDQHATEEEKDFLEDVARNPEIHTTSILDHGYTGVISQDRNETIKQTVLASIVTRRLCFLDEFKKGFAVFGLDQYIQSCPSILKALFNKENTTHKNVDGSYIVSLLRPSYSEEQSTRRQVEEMLIDMLQDFLYNIDSGKMKPENAAVAWKDSRDSDTEDTNDFEQADLTAPSMLAWITGQSYRPLDAEGFTIIVIFEHDCFNKYPGHKVCYPIVSACVRSITLPVAHMKNENSFKNILYTAYCQGQAFARQ